jgi:hypothetical protein
VDDEATRRKTYALADVRLPSPVELRAICGRDPARALRLLNEIGEKSWLATNADLLSIKKEARDKQHQRQLEDEYRDACLLEHNRARNRLKREQELFSERASASQLTKLRAEFSAGGASWRTTMNIGSHAARAIVAPRRLPSARRAAHRPGTRRTTAARASSRSSAARGDPSDSSEGDGDPPGPVTRSRRRLDQAGQEEARLPFVAYDRDPDYALINRPMAAALRGGRS